LSEPTDASDKDAADAGKHPLVSVVLPTLGVGDTLPQCLDAILAQDYPHFELLIAVDRPDGTTPALFTSAAATDDRVNLIASNGKSGASARRNQGIAEARGQLVFFTDDDVTVSRDWLTRGVRYFDDPGTVGIEGKLIYVDDNRKPHYSDRVVENVTGGLYMTANAAYRRDALSAVGMFDEDILCYEDRELALRMARLGRIVFAEDCVARHQHSRHTARSFMGEAQKVRMRTIVMKKTGDRAQMWGRVYSPDKLVAMLCPPLLLWRLHTHRMTIPEDWLCLLLAYPRLWYERVLLWRWAFRARFFVV
jgi:GT2 family glycosyltransferase